MIKKLTSHDFNTILDQANDKIEVINKEIIGIKNNIDKKLLTITHEDEYLNHCVDEMMNASSSTKDNTTLLLLNNNYNGLYQNYSNIVHAYLKKEPLNIFNLKSVSNPKPYFRDEANVFINGVTTDYYKGVLMADGNENKEIFFEEFTFEKEIKKNDHGEAYIEANKEITISIEIDKNKTMGISKFNMIEIDPYLYKSFDIKRIEIYGEDYEKPLFTSEKLEKVGKTRVILDKKYDFRKVQFVIDPKYTTTRNDVEVIPFGLKHLYFYEADFRNDSYLIATYESENFIDHIINDLKVITPYNTYSSTIKEQGIRIFLDMQDGVLQSEQEPTMNVKKPIARNVKKLYFRIPIDSEVEINEPYRASLIGFKLNIENR